MQDHEGNVQQGVQTSGLSQSVPITPQDFQKMLDNAKNPQSLRKAVGEVVSSKPHEEKANTLKQEAPQEEKQSPLSLKNKEKDPEPKKEETEEEKVDWYKEYTRVDSSLKNTKKWGHEAHRKNEALKKKIQERIEDGRLDEDDGKELLDSLIYESKEPPKDTSPLYKLGVLLESEFENIKRYSNDEKIDKYKAALDHFLNHSSLEDVREFVKESLELMEEDPVKCAKRALEYGKEYYEEVFEEFMEVGNLKSLKVKHASEKEELKKEIDKLKKKLYKLEGDSDKYDSSPQMVAPQGGNMSGKGGSFLSYGTNVGAIADAINSGRIKINQR